MQQQMFGITYVYRMSLSPSINVIRTKQKLVNICTAIYVFVTFVKIKARLDYAEYTAKLNKSPLAQSKEQQKDWGRLRNDFSKGFVGCTEQQMRKQGP